MRVFPSSICIHLHQPVSLALFCVGPHPVLCRDFPPLVRVDKEALLLVHVRSVASTQRTSDIVPPPLSLVPDSG
ncbi:hypothetical protein BDP81DRAFT_427134 [Colletotrichum phormii]|uniref:Uncharacterized protein n=1 Tax=Colletotrichum phormii TaxID=359342 RepID=A0AAJ0EHQ4_9PEZI|nr:uncharacterized protein BDP81DRAFT_427134 [Colletotrichum phormii]KAK1637286.1 hypothetical protein BDP81DRAFT_427134 [Colletotrichum phormii]